MSTCVAEIERSKKDTLKIICDGKSFFSASQNCSWQAYLVCHGGDMWAANGKRSKTSKTASFFSFWVNSRRSFTDGQSSKRMVNCIMSAVEVVKAPSACYSECPSKSAKILVWPCFHIRYKRYEKASYYVIKVWLVFFLPRNNCLKFASMQNEDFCCNMISFEFLLVYFAASELQCMTINEFCIETFIFRRMKKASQGTSPGS